MSWSMSKIGREQLEQRLAVIKAGPKMEVSVGGPKRYPRPLDGEGSMEDRRGGAGVRSKREK